MTVREAVERLAYGEDFYLKGAYSGKILYHSRHNKKERLERFLDWDVHRECFFTDLYTPNQKYDKPYTFPIIGIWVSDYGRTKGVE